MTTAKRNIAIAACALWTVHWAVSSNAADVRMHNPPVQTAAHWSPSHQDSHDAVFRRGAPEAVPGYAGPGYAGEQGYLNPDASPGWDGGYVHSPEGGPPAPGDYHGESGHGDEGAPCGDCCDECCEDSCCCHHRRKCGPIWIAQANAVYLRRGALDPTNVILQDDQGVPAARGSDFEFDFEPGFDVEIRRNWRRCGLLSGIGGRYLWVDRWTDQFTLLMPLGFNLPVVAPQPLGLVGLPTFMTLSYLTELQTGEVNLYRDVRNVTFLAGVRYVRLSERLRFDSLDAVNTSLFSFETENDLYGLQIGAVVPRAPICRGLHADASIRAGVYANDARHDATGVIFTGVGPIAQFRASDHNTQTAFMGEITGGFVYDVSPRLSVRAGYQLLYVNGVAIAADQVTATDFVTSSGIDTHGSAFFHGATAGVTVRR
jgi:hypothetical protein